MEGKCAVCNEELNQDKECPKGCNDEKDYSKVVGVHQYDKFYDLKKSIIKGKCQTCDTPIKNNLCPKKCYPADMLEDEELKTWLKKFKR